ncbi:glutamate racemase [Herbaspirillum sp. RTI4]|uniref:glutamate racemase n=1 Tax=Herbaspirillum sp. RTI4 TaxID=3048640 RepID=UPI002AB4A8FC|nr:glutamate racemase [Herbaspirillum sp. RTI4]MDY7578203.1 glutamate racemase [Herbaspirillum sp. RTI4]MEA9981541.1 glutamate racemase [Herbaspirillum sp. RTI4]
MKNADLPQTTPLISAKGADAPIGVFDSGVGGLSVLRHIQQALPGEHLLYFADSGFAPYGERSDSDIVTRSLAVAAFLLDRKVKALVVACNTATAAAIQALRARYPALILIGVEPGLKPAALQSTSKIVGVFATRSTVASKRFLALRDQIGATTGVRFITQACVGLVEQIEKGELHSPQTALLLHRYLTPLLEQGADTLVLGCTHYPFVSALITELLDAEGKTGFRLIDTGQAVSRELRRQLHIAGLENPSTQPGVLNAFTTGSASSLSRAFDVLLTISPSVLAIEAQKTGEASPSLPLVNTLIAR